MNKQTTITEAGQALYGLSWQTDLARALGVHVRSVQRWATGDQTVSPEHWGKIGELMRDRIATLTAALMHIPR